MAFPESPAPVAPRKDAGPHNRALPRWILLGLVVGAVAGLAANAWCPLQADGSPNARLEWFVRNVAEVAGQIFLRLIFMVVLPLVFSALVLGIAGMGDPRRLGRVGLRTLLFTVALSAISVFIGVGLANIIRPGAHLSEQQRTVLQTRYGTQTTGQVEQARQAKSLRDTLLDIIPKNPLQEMVGAVDGSSPGGGMLAVMFFALVFGIALTLVPQRTQPIIALLEGVYDVVLVIVGFAMRLAPFGVAGLMFRLTATLGVDILTAVGWYVIAVMCGLALHFFGVYSAVLALMAHKSPLWFFRKSWEAVITAFATSSSNATLPTSLRVAEEKLGLRREIASFVLTVGSTLNQNGTALYEGVTVLFLAQVFGVPLTIGQQLIVVVMAILAGVGTAGVPGGSLPLVIVVLQTVGIPAEGIGLILGIDRLLDMCRTTLNVTGDLAVAVCVDRAER